MKGPAEAGPFTFQPDPLPVVDTDAHAAQWDEDLVVDRIRGDRVRVWTGRHVLDPGVGHRVDDSEHRAARIVARGHVVMLVPGVVPDLVRSADLCDGRDDVTAARVHHLYRGRVAAAEQQLLLRAEGEAGRPAVLYGEEPDARTGPRIDDRDGAAWIGGGLGHRHVEELRLRVPHRLLEPSRRIVEPDPGDDGAAPHVDECRERRCIGVVRDEDHLVLLVVGDLVGASRATGGDGCYDRVGPQIDHLHRAISVAGPDFVAIVDHDDAVRTGGVVIAGEADETGDSRLERVRRCVEYVDRFVRTVGQEIRLTRSLDEADVEAHQRGARDRYECDPVVGGSGVVGGCGCYGGAGEHENGSDDEGTKEFRLHACSPCETQRRDYRRQVPTECLARCFTWVCLLQARRSIADASP